MEKRDDNAKRSEVNKEFHCVAIYKAEFQQYIVSTVEILKVPTVLPFTSIPKQPLNSSITDSFRGPNCT